MTSNNTIVISSQATFFEDRFPRKGKDDENFTKELGRIWEEFNNNPPNLDNNIPNNCPLDDDGPPRRPDRRGASPGPPQQPNPSGNQDDVVVHHHLMEHYWECCCPNLLEDHY